MICEIYKRRSPLRRGWSFRFRFANGRTAGHIYRDETDARRGAEDLIRAIRSEGDGVEYRVED